MKWILAISAVLAATTVPSAQPPNGPVAAGIQSTFDAVYNLDYDEGLGRARALVATHPDSSAAHRSLATAIWMRLLFDRGALTIDHYLGGVTRSNIQLPPPPADRATEFRHHVARAIALADQAVRRSSSDVEARFDLGMAHGLQASWLATIEGKVSSAFGSAKRAFDHHEWVLERAPHRRDAGLIVGTYRYTVAALSFPKRWLAYVAGFGGDKAKGIRLIEGAASVPSTRTDARLALALVYSREGRQKEALEIFRQLMREYPRNRLLQLEAASAAWRAGLAAESESLITDGLTRFDQDPRTKAAGERALWVYKRGLARVTQNHLDAAVTDLQHALTLAPTGWVRGRVHLELGKVADLRGQRPAAIEEYKRARSLCLTHRDPWCEERADEYRRTAFRFQR